MTYVSYEYNKHRILNWKKDNVKACRLINKISMRKAYAIRQDPWLNICHIFRRILIDDIVKR